MDLWQYYFLLHECDVQHLEYLTYRSSVLINIAGFTSGLVSTGMGDHSKVSVGFTASWYFISHPGQLSLASPAVGKNINYHSK